MVMTKTRRRKVEGVAVRSGPSIADYYRFKLSVPNPTAPSFEEYQTWRLRQV